MDAGYYSSEINIRREACSLNDICGWYRQGYIFNRQTVLRKGVFSCS